MKELADVKINVTEKLKFVFGKAENIVGKGQNAGYQHFVLFLRFQTAFSPRVVKSRDCVVKGLTRGCGQPFTAQY